MTSAILSKKTAVWLMFMAAITFFPVVGHCWKIGFLTGSGGLGDESFNDMTYAGIGRAADELNCDIVVKQWEQDHSDAALLQELIDEGANVIVLNGNQFSPLIDRFAATHPDIFFIANDFQATAMANVKSIVYSQHEGAFLAGALAGKVSQSHHIGFIGAIDIDVIHSFEVGFIEGVKHVSPDSRIRVDFISHIPDYSGFNNPQEGNRIAARMYAEGIDVIFVAAGLSGNGVIQAAKEMNRFVIGVDSDQDHMARGNVLTSVVKRLDNAVYRELGRAEKGKFTPGTARYGLGNNGVSLSEMRFTRHLLSDQTRDMLENLKKQIIAGEIEVTDYMQRAE